MPHAMLRRSFFTISRAASRSIICLLAMTSQAAAAVDHETQTNTKLVIARPVDFDPPSLSDDGLMWSETANIFPKTDIGPTGVRRAIKFEVNACGMLQKIDHNGQSLMRRGAFDEDFVDPDDEDDDDPALLGYLAIGRWLAERSFLAVINDGVARSCDPRDPLNEDPTLADLRATRHEGAHNRSDSRPTLHLAWA